ncbi:MAG: flagellar hook capping FlgD N-terminal domain-containing protein [Paracoccaceae bacterium]|nr:flagellar hook capping FlgD N-terminal domain-containing protein [Paracoccaceae bacterium]
MDIQPNQTQPAGAAARPAGPDQADAASALSSDFEAFLTLLTTQMESQDPLNPLDSADFAVQLATFSGVEQQVKTNDLLTNLANGLGASNLSQLAGWVGMEARVAAPALFDGSPITLAPEPDPASDAAYLVVRDAAGREVSREAMPPNAGAVLWAGTRPNGQPLPEGVYKFQLESLNQGEITSIKPVDHYAIVREARLGSEGAEIVLASGGSVLSTDVQALRKPEPI